MTTERITHAEARAIARLDPLMMSPSERAVLLRYISQQESLDSAHRLVEILKCKDCGKLAVSIDETRVTGHKCSGSWTTLLTEECEVPRG